MHDTWASRFPGACVSWIDGHPQMYNVLAGAHLSLSGFMFQETQQINAPAQLSV